MSEMTVDEVRRQLAVNRRVRARLDAEDLELLARLEVVCADPMGPYVMPERELMKHGGLSSREAATVVGRVHTVTDIPALAEVLASGATTSGHVDAMARGVKIAGGDKDKFLELAPSLVEAATRLPVGEFASLVRDAAKSVVSDGGLSAFERQRRSTYLKLWIDSDGMMQLRGAFDPERGAALHGVISREVERLYHSGDDGVALTPMPWVDTNDHRTAIALCNIVTNTTTTDTGSIAPRAEIVVHIALEALTGTLETAGRTLYGADLPVDTVRRLACEADIIPVVLDGASVPIDVGRSKRLATAQQRGALEAVHRTCAIPDCEAPYHHCQIHHIEYWESGGATDLDNMVPLCTRHHHDAHEGGWTLTLDPATRTVTFNPPH